MANIPYGGEGLASGVDTQDFEYVELLAGSSPEYLSVAGFSCEGDVAYAAFTVVGLVGGYLVPAVIESVDPEDDIAPIGFLASPIIASGDVQKVGLVRGGNFNVAALVFDASYDTEAKKLVAFDGAPSPTQIVLQATRT